MNNFSLDQKLKRTINHRWLKPNELLILFTNSHSLVNSSHLVSSIPKYPNSGSFYILNGNEVSGKWKVDGHSYLKRKKGGGFREDVEWLKIAGEKKIKCMYSYVVQDTFNEGIEFKAKESIIMNRRIYKMIDEEKYPFLLVHYLSTSLTKSNPLEYSTSPSSYRKEELGQTVTWSEYDGDLSKKSSIPAYEEEKESINSLPLGVFESNNEKNLLFFDDESQGNRFFEEDLEIADFKFDGLGRENSQSEDNHTLSLRIQSLEQKLMKLQMMTPPNFKNKTTISSNLLHVNDFSPDWDYVKGGSKLILCYTPAIDLTNSTISIVFGETSAESKCIQPGVIKCFIPSHVVGTVKLTVLVDGIRLDDPFDKPSLFQYKERESRKRKALSGLNEYLKGRNSEACSFLQ